MGSTVGKSGGNFLDALPSQGNMHVVMLGLDSAGKTTALYRLKFEQYLNTVPTIGFNCEKVVGTLGKAKGVQFLVWDVGGQEKLRPLWRSYTRCTDAILFVVDSVDVERMEEAKMELMRTAKCPDNQGVPILILANKQDLPAARDCKELEKLLGLHELIMYPTTMLQLSAISANASSTGNIVSCGRSGDESGGSAGCGTTNSGERTPTAHHSKSFGHDTRSSIANITKEISGSGQFTQGISSQNSYSCISLMEHSDKLSSDLQEIQTSSSSSCSSNNNKIVKSYIEQSTETIPNIQVTQKIRTKSPATSNPATSTGNLQYKGWYIQPACAITGEGLQEGLEVLYEMILKRRKLNKLFKKKR